MRSIRGCNVCVVGGAGFLGSHLVEHLILDRDCDVTVVDNLESGRREFVDRRAKFVHHDITGSEDYLRELFRSRRIKYVFNYAARPYIPDSFARPLRTCDVNFMGALKVINAAQESEFTKGVLQISSAEIYGSSGLGSLEGGAWKGDFVHPAMGAIDEGAPVVPHSSYGAAKAAIDALVQVRWRESQTPCIALRQFNCLGERETHPYIVPEIVGQLAKKDPESSQAGWGTVHLGNNSFRDFLYAGDQARMACELLERGQFGEVYNLGSEGGAKVYDLARTIGKVMGFSDVEVVQDQARVRPWEIWHLCSSNNKIYSVIESRPTVSLEQALERVVADYRNGGCKWCWEK